MSISLVQRLHFDAARCEATFSKGVAGNIEEAVAEIERLRKVLGRVVSKDWNDQSQIKEYVQRMLED